MDKLIAQAIAAIAANNISGAAEIAEQGAEVLLRRARTGEAATADAFRQELLHTGWALIQAQPTMAPLVNLVNNVLWKIESGDSPRALRQAVVEVTNDFKRRLRVHEVAIAESVLPLISDGDQVLINGRSSTVRAALLHAQRAGRRFRVICAEGRPGCEGRFMASDLAAIGLPVTLVVDALAIAMVAKSRLVLVGADHLTAETLVNKAGTYGIALAARDNQVPIYALCSSEKFLPHGFSPLPQPHWSTEQVWGDAPPGVQIENVYFDHTPMHYISGIVTEQGVLPTEGIEAWLAAIKLHQSLIGEPETIV